jgi:amino acid transporter
MSQADAMTGTQLAKAVLDDDATLHSMGYPRRLTRRFQLFDNFAISATIINVVAGIFSGFALGMGAGGPRSLIFGWIVVSGLVLCVGAAMAEIASAYPTSGALYYSAAKLAKRHKAAWSWYTGWLNFAGQIGGTAATDYAVAYFLQAFITMEWPSYQVSLHKTVLIAAGVLLIQALANTYTVQLVAVVNRVSVWWLLVGVVVIAGSLAFIPVHHQSLTYLWHFNNSTGFSSGLYAGAIGLLVTAWTFTGFDGSFHMSEETVSASVNAPKGIVNAIRYSAIFGFVLMVAMVLASQNWTKEAGTTAVPPPVQILIDALGSTAAKGLLFIVVGAMFFCGLANMTSNSRQIFAFSRDGAMPGSRLWYSVSNRTRTPVNSVWFAFGCALVLTIAGWWSTVAFDAIVSVNVVGLFGSYGIPIFLRLRLGSDFTPGPWSLGKRGPLVATIAVVWIVLSSVLFMLPQMYPFLHVDSFNFAPIALAVVLGVATLWWFITARRRFNGPISYGTPDDLAAMDLV